MASPDPEWLLWREQYKIHSKSVSQQLSTLTQNLSQIEDVATKLDDLSSRTCDIETENETFKNRITRLEQNLKQQSKINERLEADNEAFKRRIVNLEQEANQQDQINALNSHAKDELEEKLAKLKGDFLNVIEAVGTIQETAKVERERLRKESAEMRMQVEDIVSGAAQLQPAQVPQAHKENPHLSRQSKPVPRSKRTTMEASHRNTVDENSKETSQDTETQLLDTTQFNSLPGATQLHTQYPDEIQTTSNPSKTDLEAQGARPMREYIQHGENVLNEGIKSFEARLAKAFVGGLEDKHIQRLLTTQLDKVGWNWKGAKEELGRIIADGKKRKRNQRSMPAVFYG